MKNIVIILLALISINTFSQSGAKRIYLGGIYNYSSRVVYSDYAESDTVDFGAYFHNGELIKAPLIELTSYNCVSDTSTTDDYKIDIVGLTSYSGNFKIIFKANTANTGACTVDINGFGALPLKIKHDQDPGDNYIEAGSIVDGVYDGTYIQMIQPGAN